MHKARLIIVLALGLLVVGYAWLYWPFGGTTTPAVIGKSGDPIATSSSGTFKILSVDESGIAIEKQRGYGPWIIPMTTGDYLLGNNEHLIISEVDPEAKQFTYRIYKRNKIHPLDF